MLKQLSNSIFLFIALGCSTITLAKTQPEIPPTVVEALTAKTTTIPEEVSGTGTLISIPGIVVKPEISGRVTKIYFKSGEVVATGTPLFEINSDLIKAQLAGAQAKAQLAHVQFERFSKLHKTNDISKAEYDKSQADYNAAQAKVENMQAKLRQANIVAPFTGKLGLSKINIGDYVEAGQSIVNLESLDPLRVDFSIPETYLSKVKVGQTVILHTDAYPKEKFIGKVEAIESRIDQNNRTLNVRAVIPNKDHKLLPGTFVETILQFAVEKQVIMLPQTAIVYTPEGSYVFKIVDNKAEKVFVTLGDRGSNNIVIKSGIKAGDVIVTAGQLKTHEGAPVIIAGNKKAK